MFENYRVWNYGCLPDDLMPYCLCGLEISDHLAVDTYRNPDTCLSGCCGHCSTNAGVDSSVKRRIWRRRYKADGGIRFPERRESYHICRNAGNHIERYICKHDAGSRKDGTKGQFCSWSLSCYGNYWNEIMDFN